MNFVMCFFCYFFFFKQKTAYEMRISDWSSDVCSSDLRAMVFLRPVRRLDDEVHQAGGRREETVLRLSALRQRPLPGDGAEGGDRAIPRQIYARLGRAAQSACRAAEDDGDLRPGRDAGGDRKSTVERTMGAVRGVV